MTPTQIDQHAETGLNTFLEQFPDADKETAMMLLIAKSAVLYSHLRGPASAHQMLGCIGQAVDNSAKVSRNGMRVLS